MCLTFDTFFWATTRRNAIFNICLGLEVNLENIVQKHKDSVHLITNTVLVDKLINNMSISEMHSVKQDKQSGLN